MQTEQTLHVSVWRGDENQGGFIQYDVPQRPSQTILDVVSWIQRHLAQDLCYRFACRVGMCGSCAMMVNGRPRWTCRTHVKDALGKHLTVEPLRNLPVIKDLVCDMSEFFDKWQKAEGRFHPTRTRNNEVQPIDPHSPARVAANAAIECINCAVCYAACDAVTWNKDYLGPAALNRAWTLVNDIRDGNQKQRLNTVTQPGGCHSCHSQQGCTDSCPVGLSPTRSIAGLKRSAVKAIFNNG